MKLHQCQTNKLKNDMIFGHRIGTKNIVCKQTKKSHKACQIITKEQRRLIIFMKPLKPMNNMIFQKCIHL